MNSSISRWCVYNLVVCFAVYWLSNLVLWYPWSISESLGQLLMLTINPVLWGIAAYSCIVRYPRTKVIYGVLLNSLLFAAEAIVTDLIFFGIARHAMDKLMRTPTFYGWAFVMVFPFLIFLLMGKVRNKKKTLTIADFRNPLLIGLISFAAIVVILVCKVRFS